MIQVTSVGKMAERTLSLLNFLQEENGKCEIKYFDPTENRIETMSLGDGRDTTDKTCSASFHAVLAAPRSNVPLSKCKKTAS